MKRKTTIFFSFAMICCFLCNLSMLTSANSNDDTVLCENFDNDSVVDTEMNIVPIISSPVSDISIPVIVSFDKTNVLSYSIETEGLVATEVELGTMEYEVVATDEYGTLNVYATYDDGTVAQSSVYTYLNGNTVYLSEYSSKNALERYLGCAVENNIYTLEEAEAIWSGFSCENEDVYGDIIDPQSAIGEFGGGSKGIISGRLTWKNNKNSTTEPPHPLRNIRIGIYKKIGEIYLRIETAYTNDLGDFEIEIPANDNIYIAAFAGDGNIMVKTPVINAKYKYLFKDNSIRVFGGETTIVNFEPIYMDTEEGQAIQIAQAALAARDYAEKMMNKTPNGVRVIYPTDSSSCYYSSINSTIYMLKKTATPVNPASYSSWDVIMHEYGHHIQAELNIDNSNGYGHAISVNMADHYKDHYVNNNFTTCGIECILHKDYFNLPSLRVGENKCKNTADALAWTEAWATVFALMSQNYYASQLTNIDTVANSSYNSYNGINVDIENSAIKKGESCELSVAAILWDIFDSSNDANDTISLGHEAFWNISTREGTYTFSNFISIFYAEYPQYRYEVAPNLEKYKMAIDWNSISSMGVISITNPATLEWYAQGGSTYYPNNRFSIIVYNDGEEVFRKNNIISTSYTFALNEWQELLSICDYKCGEKLEIDIAIAAYQDDGNSQVTGPYYSALKTLTIDHSCRWETTATTHSYICNDCGYSVTDAHNFKYTITSEVQHTKICADCGYQKSSISHTWGYRNINDRKHEQYCIDCGYSAGVSLHTLKSTDIGRYKQCTGCGIWVDTGLNDIFPIQGTIPKDPEEETE